MKEYGVEILFDATAADGGEWFTGGVTTRSRKEWRRMKKQAQRWVASLTARGVRKRVRGYSRAVAI